MPGASRLDRVYAHLLSDQGYGWALYKKVTKRDIFPGSCGYFDTDGDWHTIADLNDAPGLIDQNWTKTNGTSSSSRNPQSLIWGPKASRSIKSSQIGGTIGATLAVAPIEASTSAVFKTEGEAGAVLIAENPVLKHEIGDERAAVQWMVDNKTQMIRLHGETFKKHGIWIVTKTYSARRCIVAMMSAKSSSVELSVGADAQGFLKLTPQSTWSNGTGSCSTEMHEDEKDGVVLFISGIHFSPRFLGMGLNHARDQDKQKGRILRGEGRDASMESDTSEENVALDMVFHPPLDGDSD